MKTKQIVADKFDVSFSCSESYTAKDEPLQDFYYYVKNAQGDIIGITDCNGNLVASYEYDPWGKITSISGSNLEIANLNPFRYRSYYYDSDIQMYYLQSRYYDPEVGRFINCDDVNYIGITESEVSYNPFAYCGNDPVNGWDPDGTLSLDTLKNALNKVVNAIKSYINSIVKRIKEKVKDFISIITYKKGILTISATAAALVLDSVISLCCKTSGVAMKSFEFGLKIAEKFAKNKLENFFKKQMVPVISYGVLNNAFSKIRYAIWTLVSKSTSATAKYIDDYVTDCVLSRFKAFQIVQLFSSWGSFMSGVLDAADGNSNGKIVVRIK